MATMIPSDINEFYTEGEEREWGEHASLNSAKGRTLRIAKAGRAWLGRTFLTLTEKHLTFLLFIDMLYQLILN